MTNLVRTELEAAIAADLPDNTEQVITAARLRSACTDLNDTTFREDAIALSDKTGRIMLQQGGYLLRDFTPSAYETTGVVLDGSNYFTSTGMTGDGGAVTLVLAARQPSLGVYDSHIGPLANTPQLFLCAESAPNSMIYQIHFVYNTSAGSMVASPGADTPSLSNTGAPWHALAFVLNSTGKIEIWYNGVSQTLTKTMSTGTLDLTAAAGKFGQWNSDSSAWEASHIWWANEDADLASNWSKFFDGDNKPISLGSDGSTPTGRQPEYFAPDGDLTNNLGSLGNMTEVGTVVASSTSPTD